MKQCRKCGKVQPLSAFHRHPTTGHHPRCKACRREEHRQYREKNAEALKVKKLAYAAAHRDQEAKRARDWYVGNRERSLVAAKAYYEQESDRIKANAKEWREANPDRKRENDKRFRAENKERVREYQRRHRAYKAGVEIGPVDRAAIFERDHGLCGICGEPVDPGDWHLDHVIPLSQHGPHVQENMQVSHPRCNRSKGGRLSR